MSLRETGRTHLTVQRNLDRNNIVKLPRSQWRAFFGVDPGGLVEIHGLGHQFGWLGALHRKTDWTDGCIAVTNEEIDEIWKLIAVGTWVEIRP